MPLHSGEQLFEYRIVRLLGQGAAGMVYLAHDTLLNRPVAIKELSVASQPEDPALQRFMQEAHTTGRLNHPNIVAVYALKQDESKAFLVMEFLEGGSLRTLMEGRGALPIDDVVRILLSVCRGLEAAHKKGIVHRDVKPENILLTTSGGVKLCDFGIAHVPPTAGGGPLTQTGFQPGTLIYMAPEQVQGKTVGERTDVYAVGALLFEMLTGRHYLDIERLQEEARHLSRGNPLLLQARMYELLSDSICQGETPDVRQWRPETPDWLVHVLKQCMNKGRGDRPTATGLIAALSGTLARETTELARMALETWASVSSRIFPYVRGCMNAQRASRDLARVNWQPGASLFVYFVIDQEKSVWFVQRAQLARWGVSEEVAFEAAITNLAQNARNSDLTPVEGPSGATIGCYYNTLDAYDATRLILPSVRRKICGRLGSRSCLAGIPNRDLLLAFRLEEQWIGPFRDDINRQFWEHDHNLTTALFVIDIEGGLRLWGLPDATYPRAFAFAFDANTKYNTARILYHQVIVGQSSDPRVARAEEHRQRGLDHVADLRIDEGIREFRIALQTNPNHPYVHYFLGELFSAREQLEEAITEWKAELEVVGRIQVEPDLYGGCKDFNNPDPHFSLGCAYAKQSRWEEEIAEYREALSIHPDHAMAHANLAAAVAQNGSLQEAVSEFEAALRLDSSLVTARFGLSWACFQLGDVERAVREARLVVQAGYKLTPGFLESVDG